VIKPSLSSVGTSPVNALHDRAFDRGLMFVADDMTVRFRNELKRREKTAGLGWLLSFEGKPVCLPRKFKPDLVLLAIHANPKRIS
jgi:putative restriction endonuclease